MAPVRLEADCGVNPLGIAAHRIALAFGVRLGIDAGRRGGTCFLPVPFGRRYSALFGVIRRYDAARRLELPMNMPPQNLP